MHESHSLFDTLSPSADAMADPIYTAQQINIPPELPEILKQYCKAAIKTQPSDLLLWSAQCVYRAYKRT